jgi:hypothetical protein
VAQNFLKVLYNFSEEFKKPEELENAMKELELAAKNISMELPSLLYATNSSYTVSDFKLFVHSINMGNVNLLCDLRAVYN